MKTRRSTKLLAAVAAASLLVAACGGDDDDDGGDDTEQDSGDDTETTEAGDDAGDDTETTEAGDDTETTEAGDDAGDDTETTEAGDDAGDDMGDAMGPSEDSTLRVTYPIADSAVWSDGSPITAADFVCTYQAVLNTPGSISTTGYDVITAVYQGATEKEAVVEFSKHFAPWRTLFNTLLKADAHEDCNDVSQDFTADLEPYSGGPYLMESWTPEQIVFGPNPNYQGPYERKTDRIVVVPAEDGATLLKAGTVDFISPQSYTGLDAELDDPNVEWEAVGGSAYEAFYFQQDDDLGGPFSDEVFREAFFKSIDVNGVYEQIYAPFAAGLPLLECGPIAPGPYCNPIFGDTYDPEGAVAVLEENGWTRDGDYWADPEGNVPEVRWMVSSPNPRREGTQEFLIPRLQQAGFNVVADNCEALPCVFEVRLPSLDYDFTMYINTVAPDPVYLTSSYDCAQIPGPENDNQGQNNTGWCDPEISELLLAADEELDQATREEMIKTAIQAMHDQHVLIPLLQFPIVGAYRTDKVAGTQAELANYWSFKDWWNFEDVDGDGQVVIGAEQFPTPDCMNPVTECANSSWFVWTGGWGFHATPAAYATTADQQFLPGEILTGEATVEVLD